MFEDLSWEDGAVIGVIAVIAYLVVMWVSAVLWTYRDIAARTRDPFTQTMSVLMVVVFNLPGLLLYLILRPKETMADRYDRQLEAEALLQEIQEQPACPSCRRRIQSEFLVCPYCRAALGEPCPQCARSLAFGWVVCPYCGAARTQGATPLHAPAAPRLSAVAPSAEPAPAAPERRQRLPSTATFTPPARSPAGSSPPADPAADAGS